MTNPVDRFKGKRNTGAGPGRPQGSKNKLTRERVEQELRFIALFDPRTLLGRVKKGKQSFTLREIADLPDEVARCIASYDVVLGNVDKSDESLETVIKVRWYDKVKALELCARTLGMLRDNLTISASEDILERLDVWKIQNRSERPE